jgi:hypothetical protein
VNQPVSWGAPPKERADAAPDAALEDGRHIGAEKMPCDRQHDDERDEYRYSDDD